MMPRVGAFEVSVVVSLDRIKGPTVDPDNGEQLVVFFSKLDFGLWPSQKAIANKIGRLKETLSQIRPGEECDLSSF